MKTNGIRISDLKNDKCISLLEILEKIPNGAQFHWAFLWFDVTPLQNQGENLIELEKEINQSPDGLLLSFESLLEISRKVFQEIEVTLIASKSKIDLHRYQEDQKMYETCDIVIEMIDGGFWEIFSKNTVLIDRFKNDFQDVEFLTSDF